MDGSTPTPGYTSYYCLIWTAPPQAILARPIFESMPEEAQDLFAGRGAVAQEIEIRATMALPHVEGDAEGWEHVAAEGEDTPGSPDRASREREGQERRARRIEREMERQEALQHGVESIMQEAHQAGGAAINDATGTVVFKQANVIAVARAILALRLRRLLAPLRRHGGKLLAGAGAAMVAMYALAMASIRIRRGASPRELLMALAVVVAVFTGANARKTGHAVGTGLMTGVALSALRRA